MLLGDGYAGVDKFLSCLNLMRFKNQTYVKYAGYITECAAQKTKSILDKSRDAVVKYLGKETGEIVEIDMTCDGSWHRRGHRSNFVVVVIDVDTGLVLDYHTANKFCMKCSRKEGDYRKKKNYH